jgi:NADH-quinone oxidoreductase subunit J
MGPLAFAVLAAIAVASAVGLVVKRNPIHGALFLVVNLASIAAFYLTLGAEFARPGHRLRRRHHGALRLRHHGPDPGNEETGRIRCAPCACSAPPRRRLAGAADGGDDPWVAPPTGAQGLRRWGSALHRVPLPFELTSVLLLAAMVGVLLLARRRA